MDQKNKTKPEENQNKPSEISDKDIEQVAGLQVSSYSADPKAEAFNATNSLRSDEPEE